MMTDYKRRGEVTVEDKEWALQRIVASSVMPIAFLGAILSLTGLIGYWQEITFLYRPIANGAATNPATFLCFFFLSLALLIGQARFYDKIAQFLFLVPVFIVCTLSLGDYFFDFALLGPLVPFQHIVERDLIGGLHNQIDLKTTFFFLGVSSSLLLTGLGARLAAQFIGLISLILPTIALTGYAYGIGIMQGEMSILTTIMGYFITLAVIACTADIGFVRIFLSPFVAGRLVRFQVLIGIGVPILLGYIAVRTYDINDSDKFSLMIVVMCWFVSLLSIFTSHFLDKLDKERRAYERQLTRDAQQDPLTELFNRRAFEMFANQEIDRVRRNGSPVWVLLLDIDHFKRINDTAGHPVGDKVLKKLGCVLIESVRSADIVARVGGEEFAVLLTDTNAKGAKRISEILRQKISEMVVDDWTPAHGPVTASIGGTPLHTQMTLSRNMEIADSALYMAKQQGRNRVFLDGIDTDNYAQNSMEESVIQFEAQESKFRN